MRPIVLVLPALDEAGTIASVVRRAPAEIDGHPVEVVVVDDGSSDGTAALAAAAGADVVSHECRRGLGAAVRTGLEDARRRGAIVAAFCDADGEYAPEELARLVAPLLSGRADYVVGSRFDGTIRRMRLHRRLGNRLLTWWLRGLSRAPISDGQSGYRALSANALCAAEIAHDYNYAQVLTVDLLGKGFRYAEVPITYEWRRSGRSFVRVLPYLRHVVPATLRVHRRVAARRAPVVDPVGI
jgi:glycosyltransferase involved in cell wall biosynthesis